MLRTPSGKLIHNNLLVDVRCRQLAKISRSTRGVVLLLCDLNAARRVMSEAQRLKMTGGHFIWIWADTSSTAEFFQPNVDEKERLMKSNYDDFVDRRSKSESGNKRQPNNTRFKSPNSNRFQHIVGLRRPVDDLKGLPSILSERGFLKSDETLDAQISLKAKRSDHPENDYASSTETGRPNIKNINSREFNANYFDPYSPTRHDDDENGFDDTSSEYSDYDKINPHQATLDAPTRHPVSDASKSQANNHKNSNNSNRDGDDDDDDLDLEQYAEASNDLKAKRADNFPSTFNISSHVFFHHFKDFPVGLLALRHIKMNVDRVFVRSAVRLFASTWSRVEGDEELRAASNGKAGKINFQDNWSANDYDDDDEGYRLSKKQKAKTNVNVNSRHNNARGSRKYKRESSIPHLVNSSHSSNLNLSNNNQTSEAFSQHVSDLNSQPIDDGNRSNNDNIKPNNITSKSNRTGESVRMLTVDSTIEVQKRQSSWWSSAARGQPQEKTKTAARGTPQYKGGCFGVPTRADMKRSELFAR